MKIEVAKNIKIEKIKNVNIDKNSSMDFYVKSKKMPIVVVNGVIGDFKLVYKWIKKGLLRIENKSNISWEGNICFYLKEV
ncbi:hypothetical protein [Clostridium tyrobutyricum]|uniref:hypothetical protein n=1 Tax=Clostridium tyrobutyricum TaxID=1519 RepID=UPI001C3D2B19|nr:hypothetical protein [Clostridium tyrobutyricum]MBV4438576.1 hypothetical protein [Clostridium tyrobutyricum]